MHPAAGTGAFAGMTPPGLASLYSYLSSPAAGRGKLFHSAKVLLG